MGHPAQRERPLPGHRSGVSRGFPATPSRPAQFVLALGPGPWGRLSFLALPPAPRSFDPSRPVSWALSHETGHECQVRRRAARRQSADYRRRSSPLNDDCRTMPSFVISEYVISASKRGSTQVVSRFFTGTVSGGSCCATMHPAAPSSGHGGRPAWRSRVCLRATPSREVVGVEECLDVLAKLMVAVVVVSPIRSPL